MTDNEITAIHESGHALVNTLLGLPFEAVTLTPPRVWFGKYAAQHGGSHLSLRRAVAHLAGPAAVRLLTGGDDEGAAVDWRHAHEALSELADAPNIAHVHQAAVSLLHTYRRKLDAIAAQLLRHHELRYADVLAIVRERQETAATVF